MAKTVTRMCVSCRSRDSTDQLVRLVLDGLRVIVDQTGHAAGRGAYVHPHVQCVDNAALHKALGRALRARMALDVTAVTLLIS